MSLELIARQLKIEPPVPDNVKELINAAVRQQVADALEAQQSPREQFGAKPAITDYRELPPVPKAPLPKPSFSSKLYRDSAGVTRWIEMCDGVNNITKFEVLRDALGRAIGMRQVDESPVSQLRKEEP